MSNEYHYKWFDVSPKRAILYEISSSTTYNKKIAEVFYNEYERDGFVARLHDENNPLVTSWVRGAIKTKQEAMETALAALVTRRIDKANNTN